jgi:osmoprotectant transport system substrate-binding protein
MTRRTSRLALTALLVIAALGAAACGDDDDDGSSDASDSADVQVNIAHQAFGESEIAAQIYGQVLAANGFDVGYQGFDDRAAIYTALESDDANFVPEYAASGLEFLNGNAGVASPDAVATVNALNEELSDKGLVALEPSNAVDTNSLVVTREFSESKKITKISELTPDLRLGAPQDCPTNAGCLPALQKTYGIDLSANYVPLDASGPLTKEALKNGDVDVAVIFSTDSAIEANDWVVLEDDKAIFNADNIVPVLTDALAQNGQLVELVNGVSAALTTEQLTKLNKRYDIDKEDADAIAKDWLEENGLA